MADQSTRFVVAAFACSLMASFSAAECLASDRPNILFILADDVGREVLECYGGTSYPTPCLNDLASAGARLDHFYVMPVCHPTRVTLLTGKYPRHAGRPKWGSFPEQLEGQTFANIAKTRGYATAVVGKWQLGLLKNDPMQPSRLGFDEWCLFGWHEGPRYHDPLIYENGFVRHDTRGMFGPDLYADYVVEFMQRCRVASQPFLAFYSMALCHDVTNDLDRPVPHGPNGRYLRYAEMVEQMDAQVGKLMRFLESSGLEERTMIFFLADNGTPARSKVASRGGTNEYVYEEISSRVNGVSVPGGKGQLTDWGTRVPALVVWKGVVDSGEVWNDLLDCSDIFPTLAELIGAQPDSGVKRDGQSFAGLMRGDGVGTRRWVYAEYKNVFFVKTRSRKLFSTGEFFNTEEDPFEKSPLRVKTLAGDDLLDWEVLNQAIEEFR